MKYRTRAIVAGCIIGALSGGHRPARAQSAASDTSAAARADTTQTAPSGTLRTITVQDSLGIPGTLQGVTMDPGATKALLQRMGSSEVSGRTEWERKKNPKVAMLCHTLLPGLGQVYNGRRLKVGLMVGFASYYYGTTWLNYKKWKSHEAQRDLYAPGSNEFQFENSLAGFYKEEARTYLWWSGAVWLIGLLDVWIDAHLYDVREFTPPPPPENGVPTSMNERTSYLTLGFTLEWAK